MNFKIRTTAFVLLVSLAVVLAGCSKDAGKNANFKDVKITIFQDPSCGCCGLYSDYMKRNGFDVEVKLVSSLEGVKNEYSIPKNLLSCHTSLIGDYYVEGHVPVEAIEKLLKEKPDTKGISLPGMPSASPGMPGKKTGPFIIYSISKDGSIAEFTRI
ncbi:hypothetical protein HYW20_05215 [Candidatus Woesearchaeota archaeon]|nr:hypothetical protein [Candidatus Woesearchaeota archaeon]